MQRVLVLVILASIACSPVQPTVIYKGISDPAMRVEERSLPDRPDAVPLTDAQNASYPVTKGSAAPVDGIVISPDKVARILKLKAGYDELRGLYQADRDIFKQNRLIYEERISQANAEISRLTPSWWDRHGASVGVIIGLVGGAALTAALYRVALSTK